jgi:hypothetical protein
MKKQLFMGLLTGAMILGSYNFVSAQGAKVEGKKGGSAQAGDHKVEAKGKKGGDIKIDKSGMKIQGKKGGKVEIKGKKK